MAARYEGKFGHIENLPEEVRESFMWLAQDVVALHRKWDFYLGLFGKKENFAVISHLPQPFNIIEESMRTDITMLIGRLSDGAKFGKDDNISFRTLQEFYPRDDALKQLVTDFVSNCDPIIKNRHKLVAHTDKMAKLSPEQAMIPQINKSDIDTINEKAQAIINHVAWTYAKQEYGFGWEGDGQADALIYWIQKGLDNRLPRL